ncbi:MAG: transketolase [Ruminiclostridium sp.]|nr:transketolase [Ruminiclostridium sp.]
MEIDTLKKKAVEIRKHIVEMCYTVGPERKAHPGSALSIADILAALYFKEMNIDVNHPDKADRDRLILSKGHACPALYSVLYLKGFLTRDELSSFRKINGILQGHPDMKGTPGVDMTAGSLGHGLAAGVGMSIAAKMDKRDYCVYVILGDGECQEGLIWESALVASKYNLKNLVAIIDKNGWQSCDKVQNTMPSLEPFVQKWISFNWNVIEIDGHNMEDIVSALCLARNHNARPTAIIAHTVKGKGVSFMENDNSWHQKALTLCQYEQAVKEIGGA